MKLLKNRKRRIVCFAFLLALIVFSIWMLWGNTSIQTTQILVNSEKIPEAFHGFTIAHISDLHDVEFGVGQCRLLNAVKDTSPDMIAITGDLIDFYKNDIKNAMEFISGAVRIAPVYYVTGNHEAQSAEYPKLEEQMQNAGVILLRDKSIAVKRGNYSIWLMGLDDPSFLAKSNISGERTATIDATLKGLLNENNTYTILLSHRPELIDVYAANNIDLALCGHAHGGQVRLPFIGGLFAPGQGFFPKYTSGAYKKEQTEMIVSRGLGNSIAPLRINDRPELIVVKLQ